MDASTELSSENRIMYELPCTICRRRKIRCSKTLPCDNCERAGAICTYDDSTRSARRPARHTELSTRLARVESLMRTSNQVTRQADSRNDGIERDYHSDDFQTTMGASLNLNHHLATLGLGQDARLGKLAFVEGSSRHIHARFWGGMYEEIHNLKYLLEDEELSLSSQFLFSEPSSPPNYRPIYLSQPQSDFLVQSFVQYVDPFLRVLHKPRLLFELNHFRRGILPDADGFKCQLCVIYALALLPLTSDECKFHLGAEKSMLMSNFKDAARGAVARLKIASTHKIRSIQTFVLYLTLLFWTGEMVQASGLLGLAIRFAQRVGIHKDGSHFKLSPWRVEMRRRLWHHIVLIDTWCIENEGAESLILPGWTDTALPQCSNDTNWDTCEFALESPDPSTKFTDMTGALVQYELARVVKNVMGQTVGHNNVEASLRYQQDLVVQARQRLEETYLNDLDPTQPLQKIIKDISALAFDRLFFTIHQPLFKQSKGGDLATPELQSELFDKAIKYCETVQRLQEEYSPHRLDWIFIRSFSWDSVAVMLTNVIKNHTLDTTERGQRARSRIERLFQDRPSIDYLAGNGNLWKPLQRLWVELKVLENDGIAESNPFQMDDLTAQSEWPLDSLDFVGLEQPFSMHPYGSIADSSA